MIKNILGKFHALFNFLSEIRREIFKIKYPDIGTVLTYTASVVGVSIVMSAIIAVIDILAYNVLKLILLGV